MKTILIAAFAMFLSGSAMAKDTVTLNKAEVKFLLGILFESDEGQMGACSKTSDCPKGWSCVGVGVCVPPSDEYRKSLPNLLKPID